MALVQCPECGRQISDLATACVGCGAPVRNPRATESRLPQTAAVLAETSVQTKAPSEDASLPQLEATERFHSNRMESEIREVIATQFRRLDPRFDPTTLTLTAFEGSTKPILQVQLSQVANEWLLRTKYQGKDTHAVGALLGIVILPLILWLAWSGWAAVILAALMSGGFVYQKMQSPFTTEQIAQAMANVKNEVAE